MYQLVGSRRITRPLCCEKTPEKIWDEQRRLFHLDRWPSLCFLGYAIPSKVVKLVPFRDVVPVCDWNLRLLPESNRRWMMSSELEGVLKKEKGILSSSPRIHLVVAGVCLLLGIVLLFVDISFPIGSRVGAGSGFCFGVSAIAFVNHLNSTQSKLNLEIVKAIRELQARLDKGN